MARHTALQLGITCGLVLMSVVSTFPNRLHAQNILPRITFENIAQVRLLMSLESKVDYGGWLSFSPDGSMLAFDHDNHPQLWNFKTSQLLSIDSPGEVGRWSTDGTWLILHDYTNFMTRLWNTSTQQEGVAVPGNFRALSPDNTRLITEGESGFSLWNAQTGEYLAQFERSGFPSQFPQFSPDGSLFAWIGSDEATHLWNIATNTELAILPNGHRDCYGATFSPDGTLLATTDGVEEGTLWDVTSIQQRASYCSSGEVTLFSPDSSIIISYNTEYYHDPPDACITDTTTGETLALLTSDMDGNSAHFSPDGSKLFFSGWKLEVPLRIWDVATRQLLPLPTELTNNVNHAQFGPDSTWFIVWQTDSTGEIMTTAVDIATWATQNVLIQGYLPQFSPDGTILVSRLDDTILIYGIPTP